MQQSAFEIEVDVDNLETASKSVLTYSRLLRKLYVAADKSFPITVKISPGVPFGNPPKNGTGYVLRTKLEFHDARDKAMQTTHVEPCPLHKRREHPDHVLLSGAPKTTYDDETRSLVTPVAPGSLATPVYVAFACWGSCATIKRRALQLVFSLEAAATGAVLATTGIGLRCGALPPRDRAQEEKDYSDEHAPNADPMAKKQRVRGAAANSAAAAAANSAAAAAANSAAAAAAIELAYHLPQTPSAPSLLPSRSILPHQQPGQPTGATIISSSSSSTTTIPQTQPFSMPSAESLFGLDDDTFLLQVRGRATYDFLLTVLRGLDAFQASNVVRIHQHSSLQQQQVQVQHEQHQAHRQDSISGMLSLSRPNSMLLMQPDSPDSLAVASGSAPWKLTSSGGSASSNSGNNLSFLISSALQTTGLIGGGGGGGGSGGGGDSQSLLFDIDGTSDGGSGATAAETPTKRLRTQL